MTATQIQPKIENDIVVRSAPMQPNGLDEKTRSITCVLSTETPVRMYDWNSGNFVDEVLRADGMVVGGSQLPLLDNHSRGSSLDVVGSARDINAKNEQVIGRVYFAENIARADAIYELVRQGHLTDVSVGYQYKSGDYVDIQRGKTEKIGTRSYTASPDRLMRVVTRWDAKELSVTPIGADQLAKMRSLSDCKFGHEVRTCEIDNSSLAGAEPIINDRQESKNMSVATNETKPEATIETRSDSPSEVTKPVDVEAIRAEAEKQAIERVEYAQSFASQGVRAELITEAIKERWDRAKMNERFLQALTAERTKPVPTTAPNVHIHDNSIRKEDVQALFLMRAGIDIESGKLASKYHQGTYCRYDGHEKDLTWAVRASQTLQGRVGNVSETAERALTFVQRHRNASLVDICQMALDLYGVRYDKYNKEELVTRAVTTQSVAVFLTNALGAQILDGFAGARDTTMWCKEAELPNDNPQPVSKGGMISRLQKRFSGQVPVPATRDATEEYISVATYSSQYFVDRKDLLADRFGKIGDAPADIGIAAREVIQDLVYACLLSNPTMADGNALFSTAHGNNAFNAPLGGETLAARKTAMMNQTNNGRLIGAMPGMLLVPVSKSHYAQELLGSAEKRDVTSTGVSYPTKNWAQGAYELVYESRIDVGCVNPDTGLLVSGRPQDYYLLEANKRWGLLKGFLRSNAGGPIVEQWMPGDGRIGIGTTVELEAGIKAVAWEGMQRGSGAAS